MSFIGEVHASLGYWNQIRAHNEKALAHYEKAEKIGNDSIRSKMSYSALLLQLGRAEEARRILGDLLAYNTQRLQGQNRLVCKLNISIAYDLLGQLDDAIEVCEEVYERMRSTRSYQMMAYLYLKADRLEEAEAVCTAALEYDDEDSVILDNMGVLLQKKGDLAGAEAYYLRALEQSPSQACTLYALGKLELARGDAHSAAERFEDALDRNLPATAGVTREELTAALAEANAALGRKPGEDGEGAKEEDAAHGVDE